jgi:tetratricopeptide (TPR) repeat protein
LAIPAPEALERIPPEVLAKSQGGEPSALRKRGLDLRRRLDARPNDPFLMHALATVMYHEGRVKEAKAVWAAASKREPNLAAAELMVAVQDLMVSLATGKTAAAKAQLAAIENKHAANPHFQLIRAEQAMQGGNVAAAETAYRKAYKLAPKLYVTSLNLGRFLDRARNDAAAAEPLFQEAAKLAPRRPEVWQHFAVFQLRQNRPEAALESLRKVKALDQDAALPERRMAEISAALGRFEEARHWYLAALDTRPPAQEALAIRVALGDVLMRLKRYGEARREIEAVVKVQPLPPLVFALATLDEAEGKSGAAEQGYRKILKHTPDHALAANNLAMLLLKAGRGAGEALRLAEQARKALPNNAIVEGTWGCAMVESRRSAAVVETLQAVAKAQGDTEAWTHYCLGKALLDQRQAKQAVPHLEKALQIDSGFARRDEVSKLLAAARRGLP